MSTPSRREVLSVAAATVTLPMLQSALGGMRQAAAAAPRAGGATSAPAAKPEQPGWFATKLKPADLKDNEFTAVPDHAIVLSRADKTVTALTNVCTHKGCNIKPKAGQKILTCGCHGAQFNLDGTVAKAPAKDPLAHYALRLNDAGLIEIDPGQKVTKDDKNFSVTVA
jgi:Rieske Fe-S protein